MDLMRAPVLFVLLALVGCDTGRPAVAPAKAAAAATHPLASGMEFSGARACVDCDGIEAWLRLEQVGKVQRYRMVEVFYGQDHERRFEDTGQWSTEGDLLRLHASQGGERVYARMQNGTLQARGVQGQHIPAVEDDVLEPARFDSTR